MISIKPIPEILRDHILYSVLLQVGICVSFGIHKIIKYILVYKFASVNRLIQCETIFFFFHIVSMGRFFINGHVLHRKQTSCKKCKPLV